MNLLPGFESTIFLWACYCFFSHYVFEYFLFCFVEECLVSAHLDGFCMVFFALVYLKLRFILNMTLCHIKILRSFCSIPVRL